VATRCRLGALEPGDPAVGGNSARPVERGTSTEPGTRPPSEALGAVGFPRPRGRVAEPGTESTSCTPTASAAAPEDRGAVWRPSLEFCQSSSSVSSSLPAMNTADVL